MTKQQQVYHSYANYVKIPFKTEFDMLDEEGSSPIHYAAQQTDLDGLRSLIEWGCNAFQPNANGETAFDICLDSSDYEICDFLLSIGEELEPRPTGHNALDYPAMQGDVKGINYLVAKGAFIDGRHDTRPPIVWAVQENQVEAYRVLAIFGAELLRCANDLDDETALSMASDDEHLEILSDVLNRLGGAPTAPIRNAMELAQSYGEMQAAKVLRQALNR